MLAGTKLGRYEIRSKIGEGGMGEVYLAHDEQLNRNVALKVLLPEFCCDLERVGRFKLEARAASALNHPNIITIHEINEFDDRLFITTEFVDGETVREKINQRELTKLDSIRIAEQIANAMSVAHKAQIIHRDIKPENIMIRRDGYAKILDFGLAKPSLHRAAGAEDATVQMVNTQPGLVMGSVRYMSPEQARGKETDARTDVWSLGVVLYEMLTGTNPFQGETFSDSLAALIHVEPPPVEDVPEELRRILRKALKKNSAERYQSIKDLALDLKDLRKTLELDLSDNGSIHISRTATLARQDTSENETLIHRTLSGENRTGEKAGWIKTQVNTVSNTAGRHIQPVIIAALAVSVFAGAWIYLSSFSGRPRPVFQSIQVSAKTDNGRSELAAVSPDGKLIVYVDTADGKRRLVVRQLGADATVEIVPPSTNRFFQPAFSPDGEFIYYVQVENGVGTLNRISTLGGPSKKIINDVDSRVAVSPDGKRLAFIRHDPTAGGDTVFAAENDGKNLLAFQNTKDVGYDKFTDVVWSDDAGRLFLGGYIKAGEPIPRSRVISVSIDEKDKAPAEPAELSALNKEAWSVATSFSWLGNKEGVLFIGRKDPEDKIQIWHSSYPDGVLKQVTTDTSDYASLSVSADGKTIVTTKVDKISGLVAYNPATKTTSQIIGESRNFLGQLGLAQMPDGRILFSRLNGREVNIYSVREDGTGEQQITSDSKFNLGPVVTPDGKYIVFGSNRNGAFGIWRMDADGANPVQLTAPGNGRDGEFQVTADGKMVIFSRQTSDGGKGALMSISIDGGDPRQLLPESKSASLMPQVSPDGRSLAYLTLEYDSSTSEFDASVIVAPLNGETVGQPTDMMQFDLQTFFKWTPDGKSMSYLGTKDKFNIWKLSIKDKQHVPVTEFKSGDLVNFIWSVDGRKLFLVRGITNSDLVLIKDMDGAG